MTVDVLDKQTNHFAYYAAVIYLSHADFTATVTLSSFNFLSMIQNLF